MKNSVFKFNEHWNRIAIRYLATTLCASMFLISPLCAQEVRLQLPHDNYPVHLEANGLSSWRQGVSEVFVAEGKVEISQGSLHATAEQAVIWVHDASEADGEASYRVVIYLEGQRVAVRKDHDGGKHRETGRSSDLIVDQSYFFELTTRQVNSSSRRSKPMVGDIAALYRRGDRYLRQCIDRPVEHVSFFRQLDEPQLVVNPQTGQVQQINPVVPPEVPDLNSDIEDRPIAIPDSTFDDLPFPQDLPPVSSTPADLSLAPVAGGSQVSITRRDSAAELNLGFSTNPANENERIWTASGGVRVQINSPDFSQIDALRSDQEKQVTILADNVVAWQSPLPDGTDRWEMYLDGNVVFAKDQRIIYADQMYYDANFQQGTILNADFYTPVQNFNGLVRMKASVLQQVDANNMTAFGAAFTSSRLAMPRYWLQAEQLDINRRQSVQTDARTGTTVFDPQSGLPKTQDEYFATSNRNRVYAGGIPVFAWPRFRTSLNDPSLYIRRFRIGNDRNFGFQLLTTWDLYQLLGIRNRPAGTELLGSLDYLSDRGVGLGTESNYQRDSFLGIAGQVRGIYRSWFINDEGTDTLGRDRFNLMPEEELRGRILWRHFHRFQEGYSLRAELGYISDRNFLESFYEREWDSEKDATTGFWLERNINTESFNLTADIQVNDFFTQTSWLPRFDHFSLGRSLFTRQSVVHHSHSHIGYGRARVADAPVNPAELFDPLAWEADVDGIRAGTRQQLDFPRQWGAVKVVPYILGDVTYWQEDLNGSDALRALGQVGIRASLPVWRVDPAVQSTIWNLSGLAHKVNFDFDAFYADASQDLSRFALYDNLDDDAQEAFRRRFAFNTFGILPGGDVPLRYDERYFALRSGLQSSVTSPGVEIADDLAILRFGVRQRWQTKRGLPGQQRIIDWITLNVSTALYPDADRDNFGSEFGQLTYDFKWHIGDRLSVVSDAYLDFFGQGLRTVSAGIQSNRPGVGDIYLGLRSIEGPISSNVLTAAATYRMSDKWGVRANSQIDFGDAGSIGNALSCVYIGESFLWQFGVNADFSRDNVGFRFGFEPRFIRRGRIFRPGGIALSPASSTFLE